MSQSVPVTSSFGDSRREETAFVIGAMLILVLAAILAGWMPLQFSIVTVFLFAGPHNFLEFRYFLGRMPARWGRLKPYFLLSFGGIIALTISFALLVWGGQQNYFSTTSWPVLYSTWNSCLLLWIACLVHLRSQQNPRREWSWIWPVCFTLIGLAWLWPEGFGIALVYLHPLMAFWLLDRELRRSHVPWRSTYHVCLAAIPLVLLLLWWRLAGVPPLEISRPLDDAITGHAGAQVIPTLLPGVSSHLLVATHTFLEMLHYGVWVLVIPLIGLRSAPWQLHTVPLARRSRGWQRAVALFLAFSLAMVILLWCGFLADYTSTRSLYFTLALAHVLAEVPFLLRAL